ncbi:hypothetical protein VE02_05766 [Pseudogymnoascus sp. 03VT05]|nr:hypothetical protein VE02_05766 [Pseudogymnoascus sp. 03VT05]
MSKVDVHDVQLVETVTATSDIKPLELSTFGFLYLGYVLTQLPSNAILPMVRPSIYIPLVTCARGLMSMVQGFLHNFQSIMVVRFFIGVLEGPFLPVVMFLLSCWYKKEELVKRIAFLYAGNILSSCFGGLIAAGIIGGMEGVGGYAA